MAKHLKTPLPDSLFQWIKTAIDQAAIVAVTDRAGQILYVNRKFCEISQYSETELLGQNHRMINSGFHPREYFQEMWKKISSGETWVGEIKNRAKDGSYYWVHTTIIPGVSDSGEIESYVAVRYPISDRKLAEERLKLYTRRLEISNRELQDFASVAAHDLQEPLRKIQTFGARIQSKYSESIPLEARDYFRRMISATDRMRTLIEDLLTFSRVNSAGRRFDWVELEKTVNEVVEDLEISLQETGASVELGPLPRIQADAPQMRQLFQNLISNALKFRKPDQAPKIEIQAKLREDFGSGKFWEISVRDQGIGFDPKYSERIFTIFQRLHGREEYPGTGVGLAVCRRIAERHGGRIQAESTLGMGSVFRVLLPETNESRGEVEIHEP